MDEGLELAPGEALVAQDDLSGADEVVVVFEQRLGDLAFAYLGVGQPQMIGMPSAVQIR